MRTQVSTIVSQLWKSVDDATKKTYNDKAAQAYAQAFAEYEANQAANKAA